MQRIELGDGLSMSRIAYGMMRLADESDRSTASVIERLETCLEQGVTTLDQADIYGDGRSESLLGQAFTEAPELREQVEVVSKCAIKWQSPRFPARRVKHYDSTPAYIAAAVDESLQRLCTDRLDLLLLHRPDPLMDAPATAAALEALVTAGKVRAVGVSNFAPADWRLLQRSMTTRLKVNQIELSLLAHHALTDGTLATLQHDEMAAMAWSPLAGGRLVSRAGNTSPSRDAELVQALHDIASAQGVGADAVALAWLLRHPTGIVPVLGTQRLERLRRLGEAFAVELDRETWFVLYEKARGREVD